MNIDTIWKFSLPITDSQVIEVPIGSHLLSAGLDPNGDVCLWLAVNPNAMTMNVEIVIRGTGQPLPHVGSYLGSVVQQPFVWHLFTGPGHSLPRAVELHHLSQKVPF